MGAKPEYRHGRKKIIRVHVYIKLMYIVIAVFICSDSHKDSSCDLESRDLHCTCCAACWYIPYHSVCSVLLLFSQGNVQLCPYAHLVWGCTDNFLAEILLGGPPLPENGLF